MESGAPNFRTSIISVTTCRSCLDLNRIAITYRVDRDDMWTALDSALASRHHSELQLHSHNIVDCNKDVSLVLSDVLLRPHSCSIARGTSTPTSSINMSVSSNLQATYR